MEQRQIFLEKNRSMGAVNVESNMNIQLSTKTRLLPYNDISDKLSLYELYNDERDQCENFRFVFTINPVCSNVLFNARTEVVRYEGSSACTLLVSGVTAQASSAVNTTTLDWKQAIRDTEYTHPAIAGDDTPFVYHCGWDIFNNHMLRKNDFVYVSKFSKNNIDRSSFNTINDYVRSFDGDTVEEHIDITNKDNLVKRHLYQYDTIYTLYNSFAQNLDVENGWYGFVNPSNIEIPNVQIGNEWVSVNKLMNNNKACEFIDLYPDRSLFSFIPKYNKYRRRPEKNWDYCLTYPARKDQQKLSEILGLNSGLTESEGRCAMKVINTEIIHSNSGIELVRFKTLFRHTLKVDDYITLYYKLKVDNEIIAEDDELLVYPIKVKIASVGLNDGAEEDRYFAVKVSSIQSKFKVIEKEIIDESGEVVTIKKIAYGDNDNVQFYYKKNVNGYNCRYYLREFVKIENMEHSEINKLAYGENIYGDRVAQIVYTDTLDLEGKTDENGRPISDIFLTIIKRNQGYKEWYESGITNTEDIEFSHCFGKVTSGFDFPVDDVCYDYNVRRLHNIDLSKIGSGSTYYKESVKIWSGTSIMISAATVDESENGITIEDTTFTGGLIEFVPSEAKGYEVDTIYYRFNTAQREYTKDEKFADILYDRLDYDDYDYQVNDKHSDGFQVTSGYVNTLSANSIDVQNDRFFGNINAEGYYYKPHYNVKLREESENVTEVKAKTITYMNPTNLKSSSTTKTIGKDEYGESYEATIFDFVTPIVTAYTKGDSLCFYDTDNEECVWAYVSACTKEDRFGTRVYCVTDDKFDFSKLENKKYIIVRSDYGVASYATYLPQNKMFVWREIVPPSQLPQDSDLYNTPFANGCFYKEINVNFFLKRQDPRNEYTLLSPYCFKRENVDCKTNPLASYAVWGYDNIDVSGVKYSLGGINNICY